MKKLKVNLCAVKWGVFEDDGSFAAFQVLQGDQIMIS